MINCRFCGDPECKYAGNENETPYCGCYKPVSCADRYFRRATDGEIAAFLNQRGLGTYNDILTWLRKVEYRC